MGDSSGSLMDDSSGSATRPVCVLVVEDEVLVRMFAVDVLEEAGFEVLQAGSAGEALQLFKERCDDLRAVIVDLGLPDRRGDELAAELRAQRQALPIVIASGRSERELETRFAGDTSTTILPKPYTEPLLLEALNRLELRANA